MKHIVYFINLVCGLMIYCLDEGGSGHLPTNQFVTTYSVCCKGGRICESIKESVVFHKMILTLCTFGCSNVKLWAICRIWQPRQTCCVMD